LILDGCVEATTVLDSPIAQVVHWHCLRDGDALRSERCHTHHVLAVSQNGCCHLEDGSTRVVVDPATAVLHRPGASYRTYHPYGCNDSGISIAFRGDVAEEALARCGHDRAPDRPMAMVAARPMRLALRQFIFALRHREGRAVDPFVLEELALQMLDAAASSSSSSCASRTARTTTVAEHRRIVDDTREYLNVHFRGTIRLEAIAHDVGASAFHLARLFKQGTGATIRGYVQRLRLGAAVHALLETRAPVTHIALDTGFASHSHLTSLCTREMGLPPSEIRRLAAARSH
jgi:AraC-like DNA-binding protein